MKTYTKNEINILKLIYHNQQISRAQISRELQLERSTVSYIIKKLEEDNIVCFGDKIVTGGRTSLNLEINPEYCYNLIINIKRDSIIFDVTTFTGEKVNQVKLECLLQDQILNEIDKTLALYTQVYKQLGNIVVAYHGMVNNNKEDSFSPFYSLTIKDIYQMIHQNYDLNVYIKNESNLIALGLQDKHNCDNLLVINIDQGVGCGVIVDSKLMTGSNGYAGEFGHQIVNINGPVCPCGNTGCLEMVCSEKALGDLDKAKVDSAISYLSVGINNYLLAFNPQKLIIRSKIYYEYDDFKEQLLSNLKSKNLEMPVIISTYRKDSDVILGATKYVFSQIVN